MKILAMRLNLLEMMMIEKIVEAWPAGLIVLSGQSGVGKSTFLNHYRPELNLETNDISKSLNRGKHTTRHVELFERQNGFIADTPDSVL